MKTRANPETSRAEKRYWTVKDAARYLNVHVATVYGWITDQNKERPCKLIGPPPPVRRFGPNCIRLPITEFKKWADTFNEGQN